MKPLKFNPVPAGKALAILLSSVLTGNALALTPEEIEMVRDRWIFVFDASVPQHAVHRAAEQAAGSIGQLPGHVYQHTIRGFSARMPAEAAARLAANNRNIKYYEADQVAQIVARPGSGGGTPTPPPAQTKPWGITRVNGGVSSNATAWVIDTGVDQDHADLNVDTARSANFVSRGKASLDDGNGHGTHVAGTIGALDNAIGVVGVAAGARIVGVRVLDNNGSGSWSDVLAGIDYVGQYGQYGEVANMSLGGGFSQAINSAVQAAAQKVKFAIAAGNESTSATTKSPASAEGPNIYTVTAFANGDTWASFSNYGNPPIDCAAPGVSIFSTYKGNTYATLSGTSMAAPHVAGVLLLGAPVTATQVKGDPDGNADPICTH